MFLYVV